MPELDQLNSSVSAAREAEQEFKQDQKVEETIPQQVANGAEETQFHHLN